MKNKQHKRSKPTKAYDIYPLENGGIIYIDRRIMPINMRCDHCGNKSPNWACDEDESIWCLTCIEKWEKKHQQHWEDGSLLKKPLDSTPTS